MTSARERELIREAALRPVAQAGLRFWLLAAGLLALVVPGVVAYGYQLTRGLQVTGLNDDVFWGVYTANLVAFIGISYGGAVVSAMLRLTGAEWRAPITRIAEAMALVSLLVGATFAVVHVGRPERLWEIAVSPNLRSPIVWDVLAIGTYLFATLALLYLPLIPDIATTRNHLGRRFSRPRRALYAMLALGWRGLPEQRRALSRGMTAMAILIIPLAVSVHSVLAWAFGVTSRPGWHSSIFGPYFVVAALLSGVATVVLVTAAFRRAYRLEAFITERHFVYLGYLMLALGTGYLYLTVSELLTEGYMSSEAGAPVVEALLLKEFAPLFWLFVVAGGVIPTLLILVPRTRTIRGITTAAAFAVAALWLKRVLIVVPPLSQHLYRDGSLPYRASATEALVTIAAVAAIPLLLMFFFRLFPVLSIFEMEEAAAAAHEPTESMITAA